MRIPASPSDRAFNLVVTIILALGLIGAAWWVHRYNAVAAACTDGIVVEDAAGLPACARAGVVVPSRTRR